MKTAMQELIDEIKLIESYPMNPLVLRMATDLLEKEKEQIIEARIDGITCAAAFQEMPSKYTTGEQYYNQTYKQTNVGNDGFEFDNSSTIPPTKGLCDAKSIYGSELNKELTLDERMHLWFESSRPNRDVCDYVDEMNDIDKAKYLDGCGISRTTKNK